MSKSNLFLVSFKPHHLEDIALRNVSALGSITQQEAAKNVASGPALSLIDFEGNVVACAGLAMAPWRGVAEAWLLTSDLIENYPLSFCKAVAFGLDRLITEFKLHRVQAHVAADNEAAIRFIMRFGFVEEGFCGRYGPDGMDCFRFARVK